MTQPSTQEMFTSALLQSLEETFENVKGIYLDKETSIFETLATVSASEASQPVSSDCATIAAHVAHMTYYIEILLKLIDGEQPKADWQAIWNTVGAVTDDEWQASQDALKSAYQQIRSVASETEWQNDRQMAGAMGILMHNAYHLGEIRHALCTIRKN
ncbi:MAG: hypothetical protein AAFN11_04180 [Chloroflexota bacterium]